MFVKKVGQRRLTCAKKGKGDKEGQGKELLFADSRKKPSAMRLTRNLIKEKDTKGRRRQKKEGGKVTPSLVALVEKYTKPHILKNRG